MAQVQKKTSTMSLTISSCSQDRSSSCSSSSSSSTLQQRHSSTVQPLCISPRVVRTNEVLSPTQCSGNAGVSPTFVKCLQDVSTVNGQLVVLECRIRGTPPLEVSWYREHEQIIDSADFRILRKKASSASVPEELCTLVITEAYPEDSGIFKCMASNNFGTVSCSAMLEVYTDLEEVLGDEDEPSSISSAGLAQDDLPLILQDTLIPPPEWPDISEEETTAPLAGVLEPGIKKVTKTLAVTDSKHSSASQSTIEETEVSSTPKPPLPSEEVKNSVPHPFSLTSKLNKSVEPQVRTMNVADLPTFSPSPSAFNYERPRHFIQSQPSFHTPSNEMNKPNNLISPASTARPSVTPAQPAPIQRAMCSRVTLIPKVQSTPNSEKLSPAAFLSSVLPSLQSSQAKCISVPQSPSPRHFPRSPSPPRKTQEEPLSPPCQSLNHPTLAAPPRLSPNTLLTSAPPLQSPPMSQITYTHNILPKPILKKTVSRPASRSTDEEIQGSKDALIQDLEKKLRNKAPPQSHSQQKMSYEERMARRLLGSDNAASVFDLENSFSVLPAQPGSPDAHHRGGIWSRKNHSGVDGTEASTIQEKFFAPRFVQVPQDLTVEEGRFCRIDFKVVGLPTPDISWYLDGKPIQPDDYHKMMVCEKSVHSFIIEIVTIHHAGVYECVAKNRAGQSHFSLCLDVIAQEQLCPPSFMVKMRNCRVLEGDTVRLESKVSASPAPQIYWKKDKEMLRIDPMRMSLSQDSSGKQCLVIDSVMKSDAGWYTVSAINEVGMSNCNARLDVGTRLNKTASPAKPLKMLPMVNQFSTLRTGPPSRHSAPLYESEEL
ncbi:myotilin-like isoform X1 [Xyrauchen texanus]|uniref:myotilin-like isoform X1 n=2 Tax=Xyrauchen texanus TaxID=154827 RepID=UPI00224290AD|nr:myotilin-like isoform X1 [Xyrauchen texanus]XP_052005297.1 myotilin-like isoform X1 [Xyrauchen texanus]